MRFARPFAVVAHADTPKPWSGVPFFSAWILHPAEPEQGMPRSAAIDPLAVLLFVSAVAAAGKWRSHFDLNPLKQLGDSPWRHEVANVLSAPTLGNGIVWTPSAGLVGVRVGPTEEAFTVTSVIAAPDVPQEKVFAAAHEVAAGRSSTTATYDTHGFSAASVTALQLMLGAAGSGFE